MPTKKAKPGLLRPRRLGLRTLVIAGGALLVAIALTAAGMLAAWQSGSSTATEQQARLLLSARHLALASALPLAGQTPALLLQPVIAQLQKDDPTLVYAAVLDGRGDIKGHVDPRRLGERHAAPEPTAAQKTHEPLRPGETLGAGERLLLAESPVLDAEGARLGRALVGLDCEALAARARAALVERLLMLGLVLLAIVGGLALALKRLLAPLARLRSGLEQLAQPGRKEQELALPAGGCRELIELLETFNALEARLTEQRLKQAEAAPATGTATAPAANPAPAANAAEQEALRRLARAQKDGKKLQLPASLEALGELRGWVRANVEMAGLSPAQATNLVGTVHSSAAALAEYACDLDARERIELLWLGPAAGGASVGGAPAGEGGQAGEEGWFILREKGKPGKPHRNYFPGTEAGNLTLIPVALAPQPAPAGEG
jgi:hypothetical protein